MFNPPIASGANIFIIITVILIAAVAAVAVIDIYKNAAPIKKKRPSGNE